MTRRGIAAGAVALAIALIAPTLALAYFPPNVGVPPATPPDPFVPPGTGGLGEPEPPPPPPGPTVQTPEPASIVTALTGLALAAGIGLRKKRKNQEMIGVKRPEIPTYGSQGSQGRQSSSAPLSRLRGPDASALANRNRRGQSFFNAAGFARTSESGPAS